MTIQERDVQRVRDHTMIRSQSPVLNVKRGLDSSRVDYRPSVVKALDEGRIDPATATVLLGADVVEA